MDCLKLMELKLYDTLTREKRVFVPIDPARVRMYVCGPTVYDFAHIGNARPVIVFDVLFRLLRHLYRRGARHLCAQHHRRRRQDQRARRRARRSDPRSDRGDLSRISRPTWRRSAASSRRSSRARRSTFAAPTATRHDYADRASDRQRQRLRRRGPRAVQRAVDAGLRQAVEPPARRDDRRRPRRGRALQEGPAGLRAVEAIERRTSRAGTALGHAAGPGWHIECSAMSAALLGETFDIHGGGIDLVFPHHENEIAQSRCAFHTPVMANYWMHNGFLQVEGEKMAKSLGQFRHDPANCLQTGRAKSCVSTCFARTIGSRSTGRSRG